MTLQVKLSFSFSEVFSGRVLCPGFSQEVRQFTLLRQSSQGTKREPLCKKIQYNGSDGVLAQDERSF